MHKECNTYQRKEKNATRIKNWKLIACHIQNSLHGDIQTDCMIHVKKFTNHTVYIHWLQKHMELGETDYKFRFTSSWNGLCNPFGEIIIHFWDTKYEFRFKKERNKIWIPFLDLLTGSIEELKNLSVNLWLYKQPTNPYILVSYIVEAKLQEWLVQKRSSKWLRTGRKRSQITKGRDFCGRRLMKMQHHQSGRRLKRVTLLFTALIRSPVVLVVSSSIAFVINYYWWTWGCNFVMNGTQSWWSLGNTSHPLPC